MALLLILLAFAVVQGLIIARDGFGVHVGQFVFAVIASLAFMYFYS
jgi:hypothetical protein